MNRNTLEGEKEVIKFYRSNGKYGFLSNLYPCQIIFEGITFPSSEFAYQYGKFRKDKESEKEILDWAMKAPNSSLIAQLSHSLISYQIVDNWSNIKIERMKNVLEAKFIQNPLLKEKLLNTNDAILIEESKTDAFWGIGKRNNGKNMLGKLLMELRSKFRESQNE